MYMCSLQYKNVNVKKLFVFSYILFSYTICNRHSVYGDEHCKMFMPFEIKS
jgi:hypothetical protein